MGTSSPQTDIYSLGVVFYEMVTGHRPFTADTPAAVLIKHLRDPLPRPRSYIADLPDAVEQVLFKALAKEAGERFQDMGMFAAALEKLALSEQTVPGSVPTDMATVQSPVAPFPKSEGANKTVLAPSPTQRPETWKMGLIVLAATFGLLLICILLGGGTFIASRLVAATGRNSPTVLPTEIGAANSQVTINPSPAISLSPVATPSQSAPFQTIEGFPDDIPLLKDNNGDLMTTINQGMTMYTFTSNLSTEQVAEFYKSGMGKNGWNLTSETTQSGQISWYFMKGETRMVMVTIVAENTHSRIALMLVKN
jgi:serine/threonine protein kinase